MLKYKLFNESLSQFGCNLDDNITAGEISSSEK